jgi:nucleotide-binding universal stress UspA family protein
MTQSGHWPLKFAVMHNRSSGVVGFKRRPQGRAPRKAAITMKTILVPTEDNSAMRSALDTALLLARRCDSYIEGFALRWLVADFAAFDPTGGTPLETDRLAAAQVETQARQIFESFMQGHNVPRSTAKIEALSFGWLDDAPQGEDFVGSYGRVFDVIVLSRPGANETFVHNRALYSGLFESGRPILLAPPAPPPQIATNVLIAWNRSTEQARAISLAMPLLQKAKRVTVLTVIGGTEVPGPSAEQLIHYLQRNGIAAEPMSVGLDGKNTGQTILAAAQSTGCDLLVKGAYTQSRLRQMIFGGATRHVLENAEIPVLLAT